MKQNSAVLLLSLCIGLFMTACEKNSSGNNNNSISQTNSNAGNTKAEIPKEPEGSPAAALRAYTNASHLKDTEAMKSYMSKESLKWLEDTAKKEGKTQDELLLQIISGTVESDFELIEKEKNDKVALVKMKSGDKESMFPLKLVKEDGNWKYHAHKTWIFSGKQSQMRAADARKDMKTARKLYDEVSKMLNEQEELK